MEEELRTSTIGSNNDSNYYEIIVSFFVRINDTRGDENEERVVDSRT